MTRPDFETLVDRVVDAIRAGEKRQYLDARAALIKARFPMGEDDQPARARCHDCRRPAIRYCTVCYRRASEQAAARAR